MKKLVIIEWLDSIQSTGHWECLDEYKHFEAFKCISVGFLVYNGEKTKGIAQSIADPKDQKNTQISGITHIPTCSIIKITEIKTKIKSLADGK